MKYTSVCVWFSLVTESNLRPFFALGDKPFTLVG